MHHPKNDEPHHRPKPTSPSPFFGSLAFSPRKWWNPNRSERAIEPPRGVFGIVPRHQSTLSRRLLSLKYVRRGWKRADDIHTRCQRRARDRVAFSRVVNGDGVKRKGRKGAKGTGAKGESVSCCTSRYGELAKRLQRQAFRRLRWCSNSSMWSCGHRSIEITVTLYLVFYYIFL